jgi:DNA repair exonuclease SbcCD nuclease subunit
MTGHLSPTAARIGVVSDVHVTPDLDRTGRWNELIHYDRALPRLAKALQWFDDEDVDAILLLGDLTEDGDEPSLKQALDQVQECVDAPTYVFAGNHDGALLDQLSQEVDARPPLALLPDGLVRGVPFGTAHIDWHGDFRFTADLQAPDTDDLLVVATHFPLISRSRAVQARGLRYAGDLEDVEQHTKTLAKRASPTVVLSAHLHVDDVHAEGRIPPARQPTGRRGRGRRVTGHRRADRRRAPRGPRARRERQTREHLPLRRRPLDELEIDAQTYSRQWRYVATSP